jgi:FkbM family methyltransferase
MTTPLSFIKAMIVRIRAPLRFALGAPFTVPSEKNLYRQILAMRGSDRSQAPLAFHPTCLGGHAIWCRPGTSDWSSLADLLFQQFYLPSKVLQDPKLIVDLGCNVGYTTAHFAATYPTARVLGLELDRGNFTMALKNTESWKDRVTLLNAAIWSNDGYVTFGGPLDDSYRVVASANDPVERTEQPTNGLAKSITMASLLRDLNAPHIDYLKMDIEGAEDEIILKSDCSWLRSVSELKIELHQTGYSDFERVLNSHGFRCRRDTWHPSCIVAVRT